MPTQSTTYNSRITDEALEKRFRDTFRSQGGAELVDDLYAQGVIVPIVDFTAAATGGQLGQNLQTAWDFATGYDKVENDIVQIISNAGFWQIDLNLSMLHNTVLRNGRVLISDGFTSKPIWEAHSINTSTTQTTNMESSSFVVFVRAGRTVSVESNNVNCIIDVWYRQIATVNGDLINPSGFSSS